MLNSPLLTNVLHPTSIIKGEDAIKKLSEMGLTYEIISNAVLNGYVVQTELSLLAPPLIRGLSPWGHTITRLREPLSKLGWAICDEFNLNRTINPNNNFAIVVSSADAGTGKLNYNPSTLNKKGELSNVLVDVNNEVQLALFSTQTKKTRKYNVQNMLHWFLLFYNDGERLWFELALPRELNSKGRISSWFQRIVLPPVELSSINMNNVYSAPALQHKKLDDIDILKKY